MVNLIVSQTDQSLIEKAFLTGHEIAVGARARASYYHSRAEQVEAVEASIEKLFAVSRELPLLCATLPGASGFFVSEALLYEFAATSLGGRNLIISPKDWKDERFSDVLIERAFEVLQTSGTPYVLRCLEGLRKRKINNARARRHGLKLILGQRNLEYLAVKYRTKLRSILTHLWGRARARALIEALEADSLLSAAQRALVDVHLLAYCPDKTVGELHAILGYVFGVPDPFGRHFDPEDTPILTAALKAREDVFHAEAKLVPVEVLEGLISTPAHPQHASAWATKAQRDETRKRIRERDETSTATRKVRELRSDKALNVSRETHAEDADPLVLLKTAYTYEHRENAEDAALFELLHTQAKQAFARHAFPLAWDNVVIIWDKSKSMAGSAEALNTPRALTEALALTLIEASAQPVRVYPVQGLGTNYAEALVAALRDSVPDALFVLGDGYENAPFEGAFAQTLALARVRGFTAPVFHIAPLGSAEAGARSRALAGTVSLIADHRSLQAQLEAKLFEASPLLFITRHIESLSKGE